MGKNIYFICEESDINYIEELSEIFRNNGYSVFIFLANNFNEAHNDLIKASQVIFCISPQTGENVYNLANERFDLRKISINLFVKPTDLTATQRQIIGKNKSIFFSLNSDDKEIYKEIIEVLNSGYDWSLFPLPVYEEPKKSNVGIIIGIVASLIIMAGGIVGYNYFINSIPFIHSFIPSKPEIELNNFVQKLAYHTSINDIFSIKDIYPSITYVDSLTVLDPQFIEIIQTKEDSSYIVKLNNASIKVALNEKGDFIIKESKGLLAYSSDKMELAKETGLWNENLNDILLTERMHDTGFFDYLRSKLIVNPANILTLGKEIDSEIEIYNNTNQQIKGSDYEVEYESYSRFLGPNGDYDWQYETTTYTAPGKDIAPHGKVKYEHWFGSGAGVCVKDIIIKIPQDEINKRFAQKIMWTGNEYQEYLSNGGAVLTQTTAPQLPTFTYDDYTYTLNPDGNITCTNPDLYGEYKKIGDGKLYKVVTRSYTGDGAIYLLIVDNYIYLIDAGSTTVITDFTYDPSSNNVTFTKMDYHDISSEDADYLRAERNIKFLVNPLTHFENVGTVKYD